MSRIVRRAPPPTPTRVVRRPVVIEEQEVAPRKVIRRGEAAPAPAVRKVSRGGVPKPPRVFNGQRTVYVIDWNWNWSQKFQLYLMCSYLYYEMNRSVITDSDYDRLCIDLLAGFDDAYHPQKDLVTKDDFMATTGYAIKYPLMVKMAAGMLLERHIER